MRTVNIIAAFVGGAIAGCGIALLLAPEKGEDMRDQIKTVLKKYGLCKCSRREQLEEIVDQIAEELNEVKR